MAKRKILPLLAFSCVATFALASCEEGTNIDSIYTQQAHISITTSAGGENKVYTPSEVTMTMDMAAFEKDAYYNTQVMPSTGDVNVLVVPVLVPDYEEIDIDNNGTDDKEKVKTDLETLFFGDPAKDERLKFGSVASFYEESSYGKLHLTGTVTDWFNVEEELGYTAATQVTSDVTTEIMLKAVENYRSTQNDDLKSFDSDSDGFIDAVWLVYSAPDYTNGGPNLDDMNFWAYTSWANQDSDGDVDSPVANVYGWASYDFMYEGYQTTSLDSHTFIHETGHFLGLQDYYSTDGNPTYSPLGKVDMMDNNIIDHNSYTKMLLGWTKPYLVYGNAEIDLHSMQNENACIVLQGDDAPVTNEFNPFSEYILIELYTNEGLNEIDSYNQYESVLAPQGTGVRIYHIDKRLFTISVNDRENTQSIQLYDGSDLQDGLAVPITNSRDADVYNSIFKLSLDFNIFDEIRLIEENGRDTFSNGGYQRLRSYFRDGDSFSMSTHSTFFHDNALNDGSSFSYAVGVSL